MDKALQLRVLAAMQDSLSGPLKLISGRAGESAQRMKALRDHVKALDAAQREIGKFRELSSGLQSTRTEMTAAGQRVTALAQQLRATTEPTRAMRREFDQAVRSAQQLKAKHGEQRAELQRLRQSLSAAGISTSKLSRDEHALRQRIEQTNKALEKQAATIKRLASAKDRYSAGRSAIGSMAGMGAGGVAAGGSALYASSRFMAPGLDFDASMSKVQALSRLDKQSTAMTQLRQQARDLGAATQFTAGQAADAQGFLAMAGFKPDAILAAMPDMLSLAKATDTDLGRTADIASNILGGFRIDPANMGRVADVLTKAATTSNVNLEMLGDTMSYVGPVASTAGMSLEEAAALSGLLGNVGIQATKAGTTLRSMTLRLAAPMGPATKALEALSISTKDAKGNIRGIIDILGDVAVATEKLGSGDRIEYLKKIFGEEPAAGMAELINQSGAGGITKYLSVVNDNKGAAEQAARIMADNLKGDLDQLKSAWEDLGIEAQEQVDGPLRNLTRGLSNVVGSIKTWAAENPTLSRTLTMTAIVLGMLIAGLGALTLMLASVLGPFIVVRYALTLLGIQGGSLIGVLWNLAKGAIPAVSNAILFLGRALFANPIGLAITAIAAAAFLIYQYWGPIKTFFSNLWTAITATFDASVQWVSGLLQRWNPMPMLSSAWEGVTEFFGGLWTEVKAAFNGGLAGVGELLVNWSPFGLIYQAVSGALSLLGIEMPGKFSEFGSMLLQGLINGISSMAGAVKESITDIGSGIIGWFKEKLGIRSPSRVFMGMGEFVSEGAAIGIERQQPAAVKAAQALAASIAMSGALITPAAAGPDGAKLIGQEAISARFDTRDRLATPPTRAGQIIVQGDTISINIHGAGQDANQIAQAVELALRRREHEKAARTRSALYDYDD